MANNAKIEEFKNNQQKGHQSCVGHHVLLSSLLPSPFPLMPSCNKSF
jgi:hypothetical protein